MNETTVTPRIILAVAISLLLIGCDSTTPELGYVEGTITMDNQPLEDALVVFTPTGKGRPSGGKTDSEGWYELTYSTSANGALPGEHNVSIRTYVSPEPSAPDEEIRRGVPETVPAKYNARTELTETVEASSQVIDFDLDSEGEIVLPPGAPPAESQVEE